MKVFFSSLLLLMMVLSTSFGFAQNPADDPKYGDTPEVRQKTLAAISLFSEYVKQQNFKDAVTSWRSVFMEHPQASKNIYLAGEKIMNYYLENEKNPKAIDAYLDTLMKVYDQRIQYFGDKDKGMILGKKGIALLKYRKDRYQDAYGILMESAKLEGENLSAATASTLMQTSAALFRDGKHPAGQVVADFGMLMDLLEPGLEAERIKAAKAVDKEKEKAEKRYENLKSAISNVENLFVNSGAAGCDNLVKFFSEKFKETPNDIKLLKKITKFLDDAECDNTELFAKAAEQQNKLEPSSRSAYSLARMFAKKEDMDKATNYFRQAIALEEKAEVPDNEFLAKAYYQLGGVMLVRKQYSEARSACREAIKVKPNWGKPYLLIGKLYAASGSVCNNTENIDGSAVYWAATDKFIQAKQKDPSVEAEANELISRFKKYYPKKEEAFFYSITKGTQYSIGCWIGETTTARFE